MWGQGTSSFSMLRNMELTRDFEVLVFSREVRKASQKGGRNKNLPGPGVEGQNSRPTARGKTIPWEGNIEARGGDTSCPPRVSGRASE